MPIGWKVFSRGNSKSLNIKSGEYLGDIVKYGQHAFRPSLPGKVADVMNERNTREDAATALLLLRSERAGITAAETKPLQ